jgi:hypothetical protein
MLTLGAPPQLTAAQLAPGAPTQALLSCISTAVEMKTQVCNNVCNNKAKYACPKQCRCIPGAMATSIPEPLPRGVLARLWSGATHFTRMAPKKKAARHGKAGALLASGERAGAKDGIVGYYAPTWGMASVGQGNANVGVAFSGWNDITTALSESDGLQLKGSQYLSLGGSSEQGMFTPDTVKQMGEECADIKDAGYEGVCFDVEVTRGGQKLLDELETAYGKCKEAGLVVMVTTSHTAPTGVTLGKMRQELIKHWVKSKNIDIISPQLYTWGGEEKPEYDQTWPCADQVKMPQNIYPNPNLKPNPVPTPNPYPNPYPNQGFNCTWEAYKGSNAKFMPSLVEFEGHFGKVRNFFKEIGLPVTGYFQWKLVLSAEDQKAADDAAKAEEEYAEAHKDDQAEQEEEPEEEEKAPEYKEGESPAELAIADDLSKEWITEAEAKEANKEYKWMHDKGWAAGRGH